MMAKPKTLLATILLTTTIAGGLWLNLERSPSVLAENRVIKSQEATHESFLKKIAIPGLTIGIAIFGIVVALKRKNHSRQTASASSRQYRELLEQTYRATAVDLREKTATTRTDGSISAIEPSDRENQDSPKDRQSEATLQYSELIEPGDRNSQDLSIERDPSGSPTSEAIVQYRELIEDIITKTLQGKILSKEQVYRILVKSVRSGTGEVFERCLTEKMAAIQSQLDNQTDELRKAKFSRQLRATETIQDVWERWQAEKQGAEVCEQSLREIINAPPEDRLSTLLHALDLNQNYVFDSHQIEILARSLKEATGSLSDVDASNELLLFSDGLSRGLTAFSALEDHMVSWIYEGNNQYIGFGATPGVNNPWNSWAKRLNSPLARQLFELQAFNQSAVELAKNQRNSNVSAWIELFVIFRELQKGLVAWFDKQPYSAQFGKRLSNATLMMFAIIWCELSNGLRQADNLLPSDRAQLGKAAFQIALQILRMFAQREDFPLYGGIFVSFSGENLRDTVKYLDEPLRQIENTQEKGRILTLLGYSQRTLGQYDRAIAFHQEALEIAREAGDFACEIANLAHLSRIALAQKDYSTAISDSQRALIQARQRGDKLGEANALANLGCSEVLAAQASDRLDPETYEQSIEYLQQGLKLAQRLEDFQSQALCYHSLGLAYMALQQPSTASEYLERGTKVTQIVGDLYLQGRNFAYLAEANYSLNNVPKAVFYGCLGMYLLKQISTKEWRQVAGLLTVLQGQIGVEGFKHLLAQQKSEMIRFIGVDGFDYIPQLLEQYQSD